jgi:HEAT repeat protein
LAATQGGAIDDLRRTCADPSPQVREAAAYWLSRACVLDGRVLAAVREELAGEAEVRVGVAAGLAEHAAKSDSAFDLLVALACDLDGQVRATAAEAIGRAGRGHPVRAVRALSDLLFSSAKPDEYINQGAASGLAQLVAAAAPGALKLTARLAGDAHDSRRWCAAHALAGTRNPGSDAAVRLLTSLARDPSPMVRAELAMSAASFAAVDADAACAMLQLLAGDHDSFVRGAAAEATGRAAPARPEWAIRALRRFAGAADHNVRLGAAAGLECAAAVGGVGARHVVLLLLSELARDKWTVVRTRAASALRCVWASSPLWDRRPRLSNGEHSRGGCATFPARQSLLDLAQDSHPAVRAAAARSLAVATDDPQAAADVWEALDLLRRDSYAQVRHNAIRAIGEMGTCDPRRAVAILGEHLADAPEPQLAQALATALAAHDEAARLCAGVRIGMAAGSEGLLQDLAQAARDFVTADLMGILVDLARSDPMEDHVDRLAALVDARPEDAAVAALGAAAKGVRAVLRARTLEQLVQACQGFPSIRELADVLALAPGIEGTNALLCAAQPLRAACEASSRLDQVSHLREALQLLRSRQALAARSPAVIYRRVVTHLLGAAAEAVSATLPSLSDHPEITVALLPERPRLDSEMTLGLYLRNRGSAPATNVWVCAEAPAPYIVCAHDPQPLAELAPGEEMLLPLRLSGQHPQPQAGTVGISATVAYDDAVGTDYRTDFRCDLQLEPAPPCADAHPRENPYVPGKPLACDSPMFIGREDLLSFLREALHGAYQENVVGLIGPRRIGKTSILRQVEARFSDSYWPVFVDVQGILIRDLGHLWRAIADRCREAVGAPAAWLPSAAELAADLGVLPRFLERLTRAGDKRLLVMLDEFDDLEQKVRSGLLPDSVFAYLRHLIQHSPRIAFLLSGTHRLEELGEDYWSFLFNLAIYRKVGRIESSAAHEGVVQPMAQAGIACDGLAAYRIWELSGGHPYFLQLMGHYLVSRCQRLNRPYLTYDVIEGCVDEIIEWGETHLRYLWEQPDAVERALLAAIAPCGRGGATSALIADSLRAHGCELSGAAVTLALEGLVEKDLVTRTGQAVPRHKLSMGIFGAWIERHQPLPTVARCAAEVRST